MKYVTYYLDYKLHQSLINTWLTEYKNKYRN